MLACLMGVTAQAEEAIQLVRDGGLSLWALVKSEGWAGAMRLSMQCQNQVRAGEQQPQFCLGVETAAMLAPERMAQEDRAPRDWFDGEAVTERVLSYCYSHMGLRGDMPCLAQVQQAKAVLQPLLAAESVPALQVSGPSP